MYRLSQSALYHNLTIPTNKTKITAFKGNTPVRSNILILINRRKKQAINKYPTSFTWDVILVLHSIKTSRRESIIFYLFVEL